MAVTYADLRFAEIPLGEMKPFEDIAENDAEDGDVMYENVSSPNQPTVRTASPAPPAGLGNPLKTGFWAPTSRPVLILVLVSLLFLISTIGLIVKYIELSHQFIHLTEDLQRKEAELSAAKQNLEKLEREKEEMVLEINHLNASLLACNLTARNSDEEKEELTWGINHLNTSLLECQRRDKESTVEKKAAEERLKGNVQDEAPYL